MGYKDVIIPMIVGLIFVFRGGKLIKPQDPAFQRKKKSLRTGGYVLLFIAVLYIFIIHKTKACITC